MGAQSVVQLYLVSVVANCIPPNLKNCKVILSCCDDKVKPCISEFGALNYLLMLRNRATETEFFRQNSVSLRVLHFFYMSQIIKDSQQH